MPGLDEAERLPPGSATAQVFEPMTGAQAACLKMLADEAHDPLAFDKNLSKGEASRRIDALTERLRIGHLPPHTD